MKDPLVSIVIPTFNQKESWFRDCLKGALAQTYTNTEIIVSDNHSDNGCMEVLKEFSGKEIRVVRPDRHLGLSEHFIFAGSAAKGEFITFLSSDDLIYPDCIKAVVQPLINDSSLSFAYCENELIDPAGKVKGTIRSNQLPTGTYGTREMAQRMYRNSEYWVIGGIMRTDIFRKENFVRDVIAGDWVLGFKLLKYGAAAYVNKALSAIRFHEREGAAIAEYTERHLLHHQQRITKHDYLIRDNRFLSAAGISKEEAIRFRDAEIMTAVTDLVRAYHKGKCDDRYIRSVFEIYEPVVSNTSFRFLTRNYRSFLAVPYTYLLGAIRKLKRSTFAEA